MYERFTDRARKVMQLANQEAQRLNHCYLLTEHVLLGLIKEGSGVALNTLKHLDIDPRKIKIELEKLIVPGLEQVMMSKLPHTPRVRNVMEYAVAAARELNHNYVGTEHLLLGLIREKDGVAAQVLRECGVTEEAFLKGMKVLLGDPAEVKPPKANFGWGMRGSNTSSTAAAVTFGKVEDRVGDVLDPKGRKIRKIYRPYSPAGAWDKDWIETFKFYLSLVPEGAILLSRDITIDKTGEEITVKATYRVPTRPVKARSNVTFKGMLEACRGNSPGGWSDERADEVKKAAAPSPTPPAEGKDIPRLSLGELNQMRANLNLRPLTQEEYDNPLIPQQDEADKKLPEPEKKDETWHDRPPLL